MFDTERKFWKGGDARKVEDLANKALVAPLQRTEARIAASMNTLLQPASEMLSIVGNFLPNG